MMRQNEDRRVVGGLVTPPAFPAIVRPWAPDRAEHVAPENPGTDSRKALFRESVVDSLLSAILSLHLAPEASMEEPVHQLRAPYAERMFKILIRSGTETVD